jgi:hypothetical protein
MKTSIEIDEATMAEVESAATLVREKPATIIRMAIRAGLPTVASRFQAPRPEGYFKDAYPLPEEVIKLEAAMCMVKLGPQK